MNLYNEQFYNKQSAESYQSAKIVLDVLLNHIKTKPTSIVDFGCGVGSWLAAAKELGFNRVKGFDGNYVSKDLLLINENEFFDLDLSKTESYVFPNETFDLAISLEVAEHLPINSAQNFVDTLCQHSNLVLFSAAIPYQGGHGHINENWLEYWSYFFKLNNYIPVDIVRKSIWTNKNVCWWYRQNTIVFVEKNRLKDYFGIDFIKERDEHEILSYIHPMQYLVSLRRDSNNLINDYNEDEDYFNKLINIPKSAVLNPPEYGKQFSYTETDRIALCTLDELVAFDKISPNSIVREAISKPCRINSSDDVGEFVSDCHPDALLIGAHQPATPWLYELLQNEPNYWVPGLEEINFFNSLTFAQGLAFNGNSRRNLALGKLHNASKNENINTSWLKHLVHIAETEVDLNWYSNLFAWSPKNKVKVDLSADYSILPIDVIKRIKFGFTNLKVILFLRDPVERALSHLRLIKSENNDITDNLLFEIAKLPSVYERSNYAQILDNWLSVFDISQVHIVNYEDLELNPRQFMDKASTFLGQNIPLEQSQSIKFESTNAFVENEGEFKNHLINAYSDIYKKMFLNYPNLVSGWNTSFDK